MARLFDDPERALAKSVGQLAYTNPFSPERIAVEREALGPAFSKSGAVWTADSAELAPPELAVERSNVALLRERALALTERGAAWLASGRGASDADLGLYEDLALYALFAKYERALYPLSVDEGPNLPRAAFYREFSRDFERWLRIDGLALSAGIDAPHAFAVFFQIRRAFHYVFRSIFGSSLVVARLRAAAWQSVFTHDLRRYRDGLYRQMHDIPTLISGASGTGKDLVAQAIGMSRYLPFDPASRRFAGAFGHHYHPLSLAALAPNVIESELFGHRRGAFTGALDDRQGFLEECGEHGTVFLDEIGDLDAAIQVKLLRVLQSRVFQRIGETAPRRFPGKIVAATNKDLDAEMRAGRFRDDLYYRLCADRIETPTLRERISDDPEELTLLVRLLSRRIAGNDGAHAVASDVLAYIEQELGNDYAWPGNVRELEQCIRNVMVRKTYRPRRARLEASLPELDRALETSELDAEKLVDRYCTLIYAKTGSFVETGRRLGLDRRTVKQRIDQQLLAELDLRRPR